MRRNLLFIITVMFSTVNLFAQSDVYAGKWRMEYKGDGTGSPIIVELQISDPEKNMLFPAHLFLQCESFSGEYDLLLAKKSARKFGISKNKYATHEQPFSLGDWNIFLNGYFDFSKDLKGNSVLTLERIQLNLADNPKMYTLIADEKNSNIARRIRTFLKEAPIKLKKLTGQQGFSSNYQYDQQFNAIPHYYGQLDTIHVQKRDGFVILSGDKKKYADFVSVNINGQTVIDQQELNTKKSSHEILLDTGLNIITLFAENFGNSLPNRAALQLDFGAKKNAMGFVNPADSAAVFVTAKIYVDQDSSKINSFKNYFNPAGDKPLKSNERLLGGIITDSNPLSLAIWDDAAEDGDSISIKINDNWLVRAFPVKKNPQFITVKLKPGPNVISFIADNLGSIPPNTSVLEITDEKKRKTFFMETKLGESNLIKIFYNIADNR